jgi:prepilin-type N-terminal cleavage/methylation domain-containing protein
MVRRNPILASRTRFLGAFSNQRGFSLLEMMVALAILTVVIGVAVDGLTQMQRHNFSQQSKTDTVQETRDFVDQMVRDLHDVGYPPRVVFKDKPNCTNLSSVSCSLIYFTHNEIRYEGDLDGTGTVYRVVVKLTPPASGTCPCTLQRGVIDKASALIGTPITYFTEVNGVLNSGDGLGGSIGVTLPGSGSYLTYTTADVFDAYDVNGIAAAACFNATDCASIDSVQITANVTSKFADPNTGIYSVYSITSKARVNNAQDDGGILTP